MTLLSSSICSHPVPRLHVVHPLVHSIRTFGGPEVDWDGLSMLVLVVFSARGSMDLLHNYQSHSYEFATSKLNADCLLKSVPHFVVFSYNYKQLHCYNWSKTAASFSGSLVRLIPLIL